jgi:hypothetical protein
MSHGRSPILRDSLSDHALRPWPEAAVELIVGFRRRFVICAGSL